MHLTKSLEELLACMPHARHLIIHGILWSDPCRPLAQAIVPLLCVSKAVRDHVMTYFSEAAPERLPVDAASWAGVLVPSVRTAGCLDLAQTAYALRHASQDERDGILDNILEFEDSPDVWSEASFRAALQQLCVVVGPLIAAETLAPVADWCWREDGDLWGLVNHEWQEEESATRPGVMLATLDDPWEQGLARMDTLQLDAAEWVELVGTCFAWCDYAKRASLVRGLWSHTGCRQRLLDCVVGMLLPVQPPRDWEWDRHHVDMHEPQDARDALHCLVLDAAQRILPCDQVRSEFLAWYDDCAQQQAEPLMYALARHRVHDWGFFERLTVLIAPPRGSADDLLDASSLAFRVARELHAGHIAHMRRARASPPGRDEGAFRDALRGHRGSDDACPRAAYDSARYKMQRWLGYDAVDVACAAAEAEAEASVVDVFATD